MVTIYTPSDKESERLLLNVDRWIKALKQLNVTADIAAYIARDFLAPMRIRPLEGDDPMNGQAPPNDQTHAVSSYIPIENND